MTEQQEFAQVPVKPTEGMLRPFYECPPDELELAWNAMLAIAKVTAPSHPVGSALTEREEFEAYMTAKHGKKPMTWGEAAVEYDIAVDQRNLYVMGAHQEAWESWVAAISAAPVAPEPAAQWGDPRVKLVYDLLVFDEAPPEDQHWEGWVARRIVDALAASQPAEAVSEDVIDKLWNDAVQRNELTADIKHDFARAILALAGTQPSSLVGDILKDCCECERPFHWDTETVKLRVSDLQNILERHIEGKE